jgi:hypothetical protein
MDGATHRLPAQAGHAAQDSVAGASAIAERIGGAAGQTLHHTADLAFVDGMQIAMLVAAAVTAAGALIALILLPSREPADATIQAPETAARRPLALTPVANPTAA